MEDTLIASYVTLIIGYLIKDNKVSFIIDEKLFENNSKNSFRNMRLKFVNFYLRTISP